MKEEDEGDEGFPGRLLHQAALWGNAELLEDLLHGEQVDYLNVVDPLGRTALHAAATNENETCARILLQAGANPNIACGQRGFNKTPLHVAAENGHVAIVKLLIDYQADLLAKESNGFTAMDLAEQCGHPQVMEVLRKAADEQEQRRHELYQALANACALGDTSQAKQIIRQLGKEAEVIVNTTPNGCNTLLFKACEDGQKEIVKLLLESGADGRIHPVTKYSPLYIACYNGRKDIVEILLKKFPELVQVATVEKWLPIHAAAISGHLHVLDLLLKFPYPSNIMQTFTDRTSTWEYSMPFNINAKDVTEQSVLYLACLVGNQRLLELLLKFRVQATKKVKPDTGETDGNENNPELKKFDSVLSPKKKTNGLHSLMSKLNLKSDQPSQKIHTSICPLDLDLYCNNSTETALHVAVRKKHYTLASLLLQNGANINLRTTASEDDMNRLDDDDYMYSGSTALVEACRNRDSSMVELLIRYGARDDECQALRIASTNKDEHLMSRLLALKAHADPEYKINKKALEFVPGSQFGGFIGNVTFSSMFPTVPVMINWHGQHCLEYIREQWLIDASVSHNIKLKLTPRNQTVALLAITRLDVSNNQLTELPLCVFQMHSLKVLNAAQNKIERLPENISQPPTPTRGSKSSPNGKQPSSSWTCHCLEEIHLQDNRLDSVPSCLFELPQLWFLDLSNNKLQSLPYNMWSAPKLRELNLALNILHDLPTHPSRIRSASSVSDFSISSKESVDECLTISTDSSPRHSSTDAMSVGGGSTVSFELRTMPHAFHTEESTQDLFNGNLLRQDLQHHNHWSRNVQVVEAPLESDMDKKQQCQLVSLNLAHNAYERVPPMLACLAVNLARLNMSYNYLTAMGPVQLYPANIKHLDFSHNKIKSWPTRRLEHESAADETSEILCYGQVDTASMKPSTKTMPSTGVRKSPRILHSGWGSSSNISTCIHRHHARLDNLRTLILADNELDKLILTLEDDSLNEDEEEKWTEATEVTQGTTSPKNDGLSHFRSRILFPNLSMLDVSNNAVKEVPSLISELSNLSVLNVSGNYEICHLPPEMGLLSKLWNLNTRGCNLNEPLKSMIESKKYKTMDIIGYLKSILEDAKTYARMKLMIVGVQGIGKTSLLEQLRQEGTGMYRKKPPEHWGKRMGNKNINLKTPKGVSISTVGVDVGDWTYERKVRGHPSHGPVIFRTWDFGGQKEYYATHQYFLSKRSLYLVVWKMADGERGVDGILQWLVNIQARAPNAPVIIVGTHHDLMKENFAPSLCEELQHMIQERFINVVDADKCGLPRVLDSVQVSCKTRHGIKHLCNLIYDTVFDLRCPGSKERFLEQKIPATYLALEDVVTYLSFERRLQGKDPVLRAEQYKSLVMHEMQQRFNISFRDIAELNQATTFLHENGVLLHYEDATLKDLYFLDPQWLCDMLAHVVTIREINPFARNGIMKIEDLKHVFKASQCAPADAQAYILNLLNKFEVALTWDNRTLLIPSLLPTEEQLRAGLPGCDVRIPVRSRSWALRKTFGATKTSPISSGFPLSLNVSSTEGSKRIQQPTCPLSIDIISSPKMSIPFNSESNDKNVCLSPSYVITHETNPEASIRRLLLMSYFPSGFWSRLMTRILADDFVIEIIRSYFVVPKESQSDPVILSVLNCKAEWICWQTGMELRYIDTTLFRVKELLPYLDNSPCDYRSMRFLLQQEGMWTDVQINSSSILEIFLPNQKVVVQKLPNGHLYTPSFRDSGKKGLNIGLEPSKESMSKLLALTVDHIDTLLEDWYPTLGTRFVHTSEGKFLVTRLVPCTPCLVSHLKRDSLNEDSTHLIDQYCDKDSWQIVEIATRNGMETCISKTVSLGGSSGLGTNGSSGRYSDQGHAGSPSPRFLKSGGSHGSSVSHDSDSGVGPDSNSSSRKPSAEGHFDGESVESQDENGGPSQMTGDVVPEYLVYSFMVEECILSAYEQKSLKCPLHNELSLVQIAPDTVFMDLGERFLIKPDTVRRGKMLGRGAFGFVFKATCKQRGSSSYIDVAMKMLQPVDPGFGARQSDAVAYKAAWSKWQRDPLQYACKAYCTARQELNILLSLRHQHIVPLVGVCTHPLSLVLHLAPQGALDCVLRNYRRSGAQLDLFVLQKIVIQIAKALEYLHQQHIIYRDLKSENVLVWELPPPFHASFPHPSVEVKLADYGISRSTLPTGAKGFGGTEGFMAPEIMRYNGEEEYTEKVDCFSFGMFMYELITLHLPFEGQECVKDHILDGGRPSLTPREMLYPTYILDLMTLCWAQQPKDRPSASQIVSIATAPEFVHLVDVVSLHDHMAVLSAGVSEVTVKSEDETVMFPMWEVWLGRLGKQIDILSCNQHGWQEYKTLTVENVTITSLCIVEDTIWLGDSRATVHIYSTSEYAEVFSFRLDPDSGSPSAIRGMCYIPNLGCIAMATSSGRLWLCDSVRKTREALEDLALRGKDKENDSLIDLEEMGIRELSSNGSAILSIASLMRSEKSCELWCGQTQGSINIFTLQNLVVTAQVVVNHYEPVMDNLDVFQLAAGSKDNPFVWSYLYPGCVVYQWDAVHRTIMNKLDCSKLAPCSESLMSISIEEHLSPGRCQVTAMAALGSELYIGTTWGCIVVAEGSTMRPITVFRPFEEEVKAILSIGANTKPPPSRDSKNDVNNAVRNEYSHPPTIITVGKGYRNLINRYVVVHGSEIGQRSMYLMVWRAENWSSN